MHKYEDHHLKELLVSKHPLALCTDDKGVFHTTLSSEYTIAANTFGLTRHELFVLSQGTLALIFADTATRAILEADWATFGASLLVNKFTT